jgi:hypothetical protein
VHKNASILAFVVFVIAALAAASMQVKPESIGASDSINAPQSVWPQHERVKEGVKEISVSDVFSAHDSLTYKGYVVEKQHREVREAYPQGTQLPPSRIDVSFAVLKRKGGVVIKFDDNIYFGMGNNIRFGFFSFLGDQTKQLLVSQDVPRGGTQWLVNLEPHFRIIFDGSDWAVGREGDDMRIIDLDEDGEFEIILPITDFYDFQDKLPMAQIPLPSIVFKYDHRALKYVPANPRFQNYTLRGFSERKAKQPDDEFDQRANAIEELLAFIYAGKERQAWESYNMSYSLGDKQEIRLRVKAILSRQPVYKFIYNLRSQR